MSTILQLLGLIVIVVSLAFLSPIAAGLVGGALLFTVGVLTEKPKGKR